MLGRAELDVSRQEANTAVNEQVNKSSEVSTQTI